MLRRRSEALRHGSRGESDASSAFGNTIASVSSRPSLRPLVIEEGDTLPPQVTAVQDLFKIRLADNDGHGFFGALGDAVVTGPTLTNVNDFRAIYVA